MSINTGLVIGNTALQAHKAAMEVVGNNMANAATPGYTRTSLALNPSFGNDIRPGVQIGTGVRIETVVRHVNEALNNRIRVAVADEEAAKKRFDILGEIESIQQSLTDEGLNTRMSDFFNMWSEVANFPADNSLKTLVIEEGQRLANYTQGMYEDMIELRTRVDEEIFAETAEANSILDRIAEINREIVLEERGRGGPMGGANALRDERDQLLEEFAEYFEFTKIEQPSGTVDVLIASTPVVLADMNRGVRVEVRGDDEGSGLTYDLRVDADGSIIEYRSGRVPELFESRERDVNFAINELNDITARLIFEVNKIHSSGQGSTGFTDITGVYRTDDSSVPLNDEFFQDLEFIPENGSFTIAVTQKATGIREETQINVVLDNNGTNDSLDDVVAKIDAIDNISAQVTAAGYLQITSDSDQFEFKFNNDSSGFLAALGVNSFFQGDSGQDIEVNPMLIGNPQFLATEADFVTGSNGTALNLAELKDRPLDSENGLSLQELWVNHIEDYAARTADTESRVISDQVIVASAKNQRQSQSGISLDEQSVELIKAQQAFNGAARFIQVVQETLDILTSLVR